MANKPRQTILRPVGLVTQPNKFGYYVDGALKRAINCVMRNPGELDAAPTMFSSLSVGSVNTVLAKLAPLDGGHVYELTFDTGTSVWTTTELGNPVALPLNYANPANLYSATGRITPIRAKERLFLNTATAGNIVGDNMAPTSAATRAMRMAGLPQLTISSATMISPNGGAIPAGAMVGYCAVHRRTFADGYQIVSVPSVIVKAYNFFATPANVLISAVWFAGGGNNGVNASVAYAGDVIELYRTDGVAVGGNGINATPGASFKLVVSRTLTAADIAVGNVTMLDTSLMGAAPYYTTSGRELYCNPGQGGATTVNRQPPQAACLASFDGRVFYGNTTDRPKWTFSIPAGIGSSANVAQQTDYWRTNGIGNRTGAGTITLGSPTITAVSAAQILGVKPGQVWSSNTAQWAFGVVVTAVGASTITLASNALANGTAFGVADVIELTLTSSVGLPTVNLVPVVSMANFNSALGNLNALEITSNSAFPGFTDVNEYNPNVSMSVEPRSFATTSSTMSVRATNGANYSPAVPELVGGTAQLFSRTNLKNHLVWSKDQQPEHAPPSNNETFVGLREIIAMASTRDALWIACLDGIYRLTGVNGQYRLDQIDANKIICAPGVMTTLDEDVYIYTNYGMIVMNSETRENITDMIIGDLLPGPQYLETRFRQLIASETDLEVLYLDDSSANRLYVYMTKQGGGWTTLENNPAALSSISTLAFQRSPASGDPRVLVGVSPAGGVAPSYAGWGNTASFLTMDFQFQPVYAGDPMSLKQWIECSYMFDAGNTGKTLRPVWNAVPIGTTTVVQLQNAAYARAGIPREHAVAQSLSAGCDSVTGATPQARFLGLSLMFNPLTTQAKQRV